MQRIKLYSQIATNLSALSNEKLKQILADGKHALEIYGLPQELQRVAINHHNYKNLLHWCET